VHAPHQTPQVNLLGVQRAFDDRYFYIRALGLGVNRWTIQENLYDYLENTDVL